MAGPLIAGVDDVSFEVRRGEVFAFLGPLSGTQLYLDFYAEDAAAFSPRLPEAVRSDVARLWNDANKDGFGLLGPNLQVLFSADGNDATLATLLTALRARRTAILPGYKADSPPSARSASAATWSGASRRWDGRWPASTSSPGSRN